MDGDSLLADEGEKVRKLADRGQAKREERRERETVYCQLITLLTAKLQGPNPSTISVLRALII